MNGLIKELIELATESAGYEGLGGSYTRLNEEKFAELIVKECVRIINVQHDISIEDGWNAGETCGILVNDILDRFGVE